MGPWSALEKRTAILMLSAIALWSTDFLHHISPAMIGLGVGLVAVLPRLGVLDTKDMKRVNILAFFFVGASISMSQVLVDTKGLDFLTQIAFGWLKPFMTNSLTATLALYWTAFIYHIFAGPELSMIGVSLPALMQFAKEQNLDPLSNGMIWTFAVGGKIFVYQSTTLIVGYSYGFFDSWDCFRIGLSLTVVESLILLFLVPLYWPLIGLGLG